MIRIVRSAVLNAAERSSPTRRKAFLLSALEQIKSNECSRDVSVEKLFLEEAGC